MELLGAHPGISVIDPSSVLTRLWYFDGKFLRAEGFRLDQEYVRSLVALSNQAVGYGIVHGFDVRRRGGDAVRVDGGVALAPSGRVIHLPGEIDLSVAELIERSTGEFDPGVAVTPRTAEFGPCPPERPDAPVTGVPPRALYVLTVAAAEALCGDEERFGQLCEDACAKETDRSLAVEGARFRVRELRLSLPVSARVPFDRTHIRSRVATAYFDSEQRATPSMISGSGLRSGVWCAGAEGVGGEEVPLAVFERSGKTTTWLDMWVARRELVETTPHRYWGWRLSMRPLDVFLAQLLQFQCQLLDGPNGKGGSGVDDPCAEKSSVLTEADDVLASLIASDPAATALVELRERISGALSGPVRSVSGSLFIDWGIVTLPSGGYVPIDPTQPLEAQLHAMMGPGVDLRFCAVRPDYIPEALQEAQHMERISLFQGIDNPSAIEEVDILVPGGLVTETSTAVEAFEGRLRILPAVRKDDRGYTRGSVLTLAAVARDHIQPGWSWTLAAHGEVPPQLAVGGLVAAVFNGFRFADEDGDARREANGGLHVEVDDVHDAILADVAFYQRLTREGVRARERHERAVIGAVAPDRRLRDERRQLIGIWFDVETDRDLREVPIGGQAALRLRATTYARGNTEPLLLDAQITGSLVVTDRRSRHAPGGSRVIDLVTEVNGAVDPLAIVAGQEHDLPPQRIKGVSLDWRIGVSSLGVRILNVSLGRGHGGARAMFDDRGDPRQVHGLLSMERRGDSPMFAGDWTPLAAAASGDSDSTRAVGLELELSESPGALDIGARGRSLGEAVIDIIGAELADRDRDASFTTVARYRLFDAERGSTSAVTPQTDWVMFHRRRTRICAGPSELPKAIRRIRWLHAVTDDRSDLQRFASLAGRWEEHGDTGRVRVQDRVDQLGFKEVAVAEFLEQSTELASSRVALRAAWSAAPRGSHLITGVVASPPTSDGEQVDLGRLGTATSAVADLIDTSHMRTSVTSAIPPEFQVTGIDGVFFTVGFQPPEADFSRVLLVRLSEDEFDKIVTGLQRFDEVTQQDLDDLLRERPEDVFVAVFVGTELENPDNLGEWAETGPPVDFGVFGLASSIQNTPDADAELVTGWTEAVQRPFGLQSFQPIAPVGDLRWSIDDWVMIVFLVGKTI
ncbi:hypothetical protein MPY17_39480 (plasmid) [Rhodococcus opacus]|nr:hypothetical protein [Rhodococcus opacus]UOT08376.1 hypothetical protein MPY17_39480 [Rhodococcus opacus]